MRVLHVAHHAYIDPASGAAHSVRSMIEILAAAGHECAVVASGRFDDPGTKTLDAAHDALGVHVRRDVRSGARPIHRYRLHGVDVVSVGTRHAKWTDEDPKGNAQFAAEVDRALARRPDLVVAYGAHPITLDALKRAKQKGAQTVFNIRNWGYEDPRLYRHVDRVLMTSAHVARVYAERHGIHGTGIASPILYADVEGDAEARGFVTFVNPSLHKGLAPFARIADMLGRRRPDIPLLVVQSRADASVLAAIPGLDLARHRQILVSPPIDTPRELWSLAKIALMPTVNAEPFGRIAAEAMINGVPVLVSDRGGLPETVADGGFVLPLPDWLESSVLRIPTEAEMEPWFDTIVRLWDDEAEYARAADAGRATAKRLYDEAAARRRYLDYFEDPGPFEPVVRDAMADSSR